MFNTYRLSRFSIALVLMLLYMSKGFTQISILYRVGESCVFNVNLEQGINYCWKVTETIEPWQGVETKKVTYLTKKNNSSIGIRWEKTGNFFVSVTGINLNGCMNIKVFQISVFDQHIPIANDDYVSTTWVNSIRVDLLRNDHDTNNDIDSSSLRILTRTELGDITIEKAGIITYIPRHNHSGTEKFLYQISDSCSQKDTAMVSIRISDPPFFLPEGISPNGDGINDRLVISGLYAYPNSSLTIFSRDGLTIYHSDDYQNDWEGVQDKQKHGIRPVPSGTYYYLLHLGGTNRIIRGFFFLAE
ncbi:MAG: gliding motility-associated C-terminal domain-containing protein [Prolixibacteraceae bacterium]